ncbi:MAG TPA: L-2-amino-thiazoline-4-carboxylic acid hydrolase [Anaerolineales bacterium]|nr:L-2-amino-thiazoline-4-carboxylic acid hydrolase [Anaerolineales bacterium]
MEHNPTPPADYMNAVGLLNRREIEARILAPLLSALMLEFDRDKVWQIARKVIQEAARQQGLQLANSVDKNDLEHFAEIQETWKKDNAIQTEVLELTNKRFSFNVFRCRYAEMYQHLGVPELGMILSCERDFALIEGYNPKIKLTRTQTIMEGADLCDFCFELKTARKPHR